MISLKTCYLLFILILLKTNVFSQDDINLWIKNYVLSDQSNDIEKIIENLNDDFEVFNDSSYFDYEGYMNDIIRRSKIYKNEKTLDTSQFKVNDYVKVDSNRYIYAFFSYVNSVYSPNILDSTLEKASILLEDTSITAIFPSFHLDTIICHYHFSEGKIVKFEEILKTKGIDLPQQTIEYKYSISKNTLYILSQSIETNELFSFKFGKSIQANKLYLFVCLNNNIELHDLDLLARLLLYYPELLEDI